MATKTKKSEISRILDEIVTESEMDLEVTLSYLNDATYAERPMKKPVRRWLKEYLEIAKKRKVKWKTRKSVDPTGGDQVRIWTEDLKGTILAEDCDFSVWQMPDDTLGRDFVKFLHDIAKKEGDE